MVKNIRHSGIVINNIAKALMLYRDILGFKIVSRETFTNTKLNKKLFGNLYSTIICIKLGVEGYQGLLEFYYTTDKNSNIFSYYNSYNHLSFTVDNLNDIIKKIRKLKLKVIYRYRVKNKKIAFFRDFDYNLIELVEEKVGRI